MCVTVGEVLVTSGHKWIPVYDCMFPDVKALQNMFNQFDNLD